MGSRVPWIPLQLLGGASSGDSGGMVGVPSGASLTDTLKATGDRLGANGWRADPARTIGEHTVVTAHRGGLTVIIAGESLRGSRSILYVVWQQARGGGPSLEPAVHTLAVKLSYWFG